MPLEVSTQTQQLSVLFLPFSLFYLLGFWRKSKMPRSCMLSWNTSGASKSRCHREVSSCTWEMSVRNETISLTKVSWYSGLCCTLTNKNVRNYLRTRRNYLITTRNYLITRSLAAGGYFCVFQLALHLHASLQNNTFKGQVITESVTVFYLHTPGCTINSLFRQALRFTMS